MKNLKEYILENIENIHYNYHISVFTSKKLEDTKKVKNIIKCIEEFKDIELLIDCGKYGTMTVKFYNFSKGSKTCDVILYMSNLSKIIKMDSGKDTYEDHLPIRDAWLRVSNIINKIGEKL